MNQSIPNGDMIRNLVLHLNLIYSAVPGGQSSQYSPEQFFLHLHVNPIPSAEGIQTPRLTQGLGLQGSKSESRNILISIYLDNIKEL